MSDLLDHLPSGWRRSLLGSRLLRPFAKQRKTAADQPRPGCSSPDQNLGKPQKSAVDEISSAVNSLQKTAKTASQGSQDFVDHCRAAWEHAGLELAEQQRFDVAEALAGIVYPGYHFSEFARIYLKDKEFAQFYREFVSTYNFHSYDRKYLLQEILELCRNVPGDTAECGVYEGAGSYLIGRHAAGLGRLHHMFDSFAGLSQPQPIDGSYWKPGVMSVPEERVREKLKDLNNLRYWPGWIPERFAEVADCRFSFVHIDVDLYQPTSESVAFFYPRMNAGGLMLFDDYGFETCPGARRAIDDFFADKPEPIIDLPTVQAFVQVEG